MYPGGTDAAGLVDAAITFILLTAREGLCGVSLSLVWKLRPGKVSSLLSPVI